MLRWIRRLFGRAVAPQQAASPEPRGPVPDLSRQAEKLARAAGIRNAEEAFRLLDEGALDGTLLETKLRSIRFLQDRPTQRALTSV